MRKSKINLEGTIIERIEFDNAKQTEEYFLKNFHSNVKKRLSTKIVGTTILVFPHRSKSKKTSAIFPINRLV